MLIRQHPAAADDHERGACRDCSIDGAVPKFVHRLARLAFEAAPPNRRVQRLAAVETTSNVNYGRAIAGALPVESPI
jgi:hypothetical protein